MSDWLTEVSIPSEVKEFVGNSELKTDQDKLNIPKTTRFSENHMRMIDQIIKKLTIDPKKPYSKDDVLRLALEDAYKVHVVSVTK